MSKERKPSADLSVGNQQEAMRAINILHVANNIRRGDLNGQEEDLDAALQALADLPQELLDAIIEHQKAHHHKVASGQPQTNREVPKKQEPTL